MVDRLFVMPMDKREAAVCAEKKHYLHRAPACSYAFQLTDAEIMGTSATWPMMEWGSFDLAA